MRPRPLRIKRSIWLRGEGKDRSALLRTYDGKQCGVGIYLRSVGVKRKAMADVASAAKVKDVPLSARWLLEGDCNRDSVSARALYRANDVVGEFAEDEQDREATIARIFAEHGVLVRFED